MSQAKLSFVLYADVRAQVKKLSDTEAGRLFVAILDYAADGAIPELEGATDMCFAFIQAQIDRDSEKWEEKRQKRIEAGHLGGLASGESRNQKQAAKSNASFATEAEADTAVPASVPALVSASVPDSVYLRERGNVDKPRFPRHEYGQYKNVRLSTQDLEKLKAEFPTDWEGRIERLDGYIESKGAKYKNHLATIRNWAKQDEKEPTKAAVTTKRICDFHGGAYPSER